MVCLGPLLTAVGQGGRYLRRRVGQTPRRPGSNTARSGAQRGFALQFNYGGMHLDSQLPDLITAGRIAPGAIENHRPAAGQMDVGSPNHLVIDGGDIGIGVQADIQHTCRTNDCTRILQGSAHFVGGDHRCANPLG